MSRPRFVIETLHGVGPDAVWKRFIVDRLGESEAADYLAQAKALAPDTGKDPDRIRSRELDEHEVKLDIINRHQRQFKAYLIGGHSIEQLEDIVARIDDPDPDPPIVTAYTRSGTTPRQP